MTGAAGPEAGYKFDFTIDYADFKALNASACRNSACGIIRKAFVIAVVLVGLSLVAISYLAPEIFAENPLLFDIPAGLLTGGGLTAVFFMAIAPWIRRRQFAQSAFANKRSRLTLTEAGIDTAFDTVQSSFAWASIRRLDILPDHMLLFIDQRQALIVARRGIDAAAWPEAVALARTHVRKAP